MCGKLFKSPKRLQEHHRLKHSAKALEKRAAAAEGGGAVKKRGGWGKPGPFLCDQCSAEFKKKCLLGERQTLIRRDW